MNNEEWFSFFKICAENLGAGNLTPSVSNNWCAWTTFTRLSENAGYWTCGLPATTDIHPTHIGDGGVWGQPFHYTELAHIVLPRTFYWETFTNEKFENGFKNQNIEALSKKLSESGILHRVTELVLEIKLY